MDSKERKKLFDRLGQMKKEEKKPMSDDQRQAGLLQRLDRMQELEKDGAVEGHKQAKKDIWRKLSEQALQKSK